MGIIKHIEEGTTTVDDAKRFKEIVFGSLLIGIAIGIGIGAILLLW